MERPYPTDTIMNAQYLAGFFDGERWVGIHKQGKLNYGISVAIGQRNIKILKEIQKQFNGHLTTGNIDKRTGRMCPIWKLNANKAIPFLLYILPFVKIKQKKIS